MSNAQGFKASLVAGEESAFGIGAASSTPNVWKFPIVKPGIKGSQNLLSSRVLLDDANPRKVVSGNRAVSGGVEMEASPKSIGWWLKWLTGTVSSTAVGTGASYTITGAQTKGAVTLALTAGTGTLPVNTWVNITHTNGKVLPYRINTSVGSPVTSVTIDGGLLFATSAGAAIAVIASYAGHKFTVGAASPTSIFVEGRFSDVSRFHLYSGVYVDKMNFRFTPEGLMSYTVDIEGQQFAYAGATAVTGTVTDPGHSPFSYFGATINQGSNILGIVKAMDFTVSRERDKNQYVIDGTGTRGSIPGGIMMIEGTVKVLYQDDALATLANDGTETSLRATVRDGSAALSMFFPEVRLEVTTPDVVSEAVIEQDHPFKAFYDDNTDTSALVATLNSLQASYASM